MPFLNPSAPIRPNAWTPFPRLITSIDFRWLHDKIKPGGKWSSEQVIIFTEYRATQNRLLEVLASERLTGGDRLLTMYGGMRSEDREAIKAAFQTAPDKSPVRILLATDAKVGDLEADLEFLMRAVRKVEQIREDLGKVGPVIAEQVDGKMPCSADDSERTQEVKFRTNSTTPNTGRWNCSAVAVTFLIPAKLAR